MRATEHLDRLTKALAEVGWSSRPRYEEIPALLRVWHPAFPQFGESLSVRPRGGEPWFWTSDPQPLAPCDDLTRAIEEIDGLLMPCVTAALLGEDRPRAGGA